MLSVFFLKRSEAVLEGRVMFSFCLNTFVEAVSSFFGNYIVLKCFFWEYGA